MHGDDTEWIIYAFSPEIRPQVGWAQSQGRLWAYVAGPQFLLALRNQGNWVGEFLRYGSFLLFVTLFYAVIWKLFSRRLALLAATLFIATLAVRFEGSVLITYPMYTWTAGSAFMAATLAALHYSRHGKVAALVAAGVLLFFSYFTQEGLMALFVLLFPALLVLDTKVAWIDPRGIVAKVMQPRQRRLLLTWAMTVIVYIVLAGGWSLTHPSNYRGHSFAPFDLANIAAVLVSFSTAASLIGDLVSPYVVQYIDVIAGSAATVSYDPWNVGWNALTGTEAMVAAVLCAAIVYVVLSRRSPGGSARRPPSWMVADQSGVVADKSAVGAASRSATKSASSETASVSSAWQLAGAFLTGLAIALIPLAPVAMTDRYQTWHFDAGINAHSHSIVAQFGWSLSIAAALLASCMALVRRLPRPAYNAAVILLAATVGLLAAAGSANNRAILADVRPEGLRWDVMDRAIAAADVYEPPLRSLWAPRFVNGSPFTRVKPDYWARYASKRHGSALTVTAGELGAEQMSAGGAALLDYFPTNDRRTSTVLLARLEPVGSTVQATSVVIDAVASTSSYLSRTFLFYRDTNGRSRAVRLSDMEKLEPDMELRYLGNLQAEPSSITITDAPGNTAQAESCLFGVELGSKVHFGRSPAPADAGECRLGTPTAGWFPPEPAGVWSQGPRSELAIQGNAWPSGSVALTFDLSTLAGMRLYEGLQTVAISVNGRQLASRMIDGGMVPPVRVIVPPELRDADNSLVVTFDVSEPIVPAEVMPTSADTRSLGVYLRAMSATLP